MSDSQIHSHSPSSISITFRYRLPLLLVISLVSNDFAANPEVFELQLHNSRNYIYFTYIFCMHQGLCKLSLVNYEQLSEVKILIAVKNLEQNRLPHSCFSFKIPSSIDIFVQKNAKFVTFDPQQGVPRSPKKVIHLVRINSKIWVLWTHGTHTVWRLRLTQPP